MRYLVVLFILVSYMMVLSSCENDENNQTQNIENTPVENNEEEIIEQFSDSLEEDIVAEEMEETAVEEIKEDAGLSFCDCVKKQKELENVMLETEDDDEFDAAMEEMENMKSGACKILFEGNQSTIEAKQAHEAKVNDCL